MVIKVAKNKPKYGRYFLFTEAPGDEEDVTINRRQVQEPDDDYDTDFNNIDTDNYDGVGSLDDDDDDYDTDFNKLVYSADDDQEADANQDNAEAEPAEQADDNADQPEAQQDNQPAEEAETPTETNEETPEQTEEAPAEEQPADDQTQEETPENQDQAAEAETGEEPAEDANTGTEEDQGAENPDEYADQDTNFNDDNPDDAATDDGTADAEGDAAADGTDAGDNQDGERGPGLEYDSTRKYKLFKEYMALYIALNNYISKLESNIKDDIVMNQLTKIASNKLREIKDITYDYMILKYNTSTYIQSVTFYQKLVVSIQLVFNLLNKEQ